MTADKYSMAISHLPKSLSITGGFLEDQSLEFTDGQNCIYDGAGK